MLAATGERYLAVAATGVYAPAYTNTPSPGNVLKSFGQPNAFGMWWSRSDAVSMMTGEAPHRFYQKMYRNDDTEIARWSLFYKTAINFYTEVAREWELMVRNCYLFEYVYPELFNAPAPIPEVTGHKAATKIGLPDYLASMQADHDGYAPSVTALRNILANGALVDRAADIYAGAFPRPWQTTTGLFDWNVSTTPFRLVDDFVWLVPSAFSGADGFRSLVAESLRRIADLEASWELQKQRLIELDRKVLHDRIFVPVADVNAIRMTATADEQRRKAEYDRFTDIRTATLVSQLLGGEPVDVASRPDEIQIEQRFNPNAGRKGRVQLEEHARRLVPEGIVAEKHVVLAVNDALKVDKLDTLILGAAFRESMTDIFTRVFPDRSIAEIVADIRASVTAVAVSLGQLHYYLTIVEEAVSKASETGAQPGDLTAF